MKRSSLSLNNFNVIEDDKFYYVFRALNKLDHNDLANNVKDGAIRTDRERHEEQYGTAKYKEDDSISLEEIWDHIKMRYLKETNCISISTNANVSLDYGSNYYDDYAIIKVPKFDTKEYYHAGSYMLGEIKKTIDEILKSNRLDINLVYLISKIDNANKNEDIVELMSRYTADSDKYVMSRFQDRQYFNDKQQLEYNKIVAKLTLLELTGIKPSILPNNTDNSSLLATVNNAFSSGELVHYKDIPKEDYKLISKKMMSLLALTQQLKDKGTPNASLLEQKVIELINNNYDFVEKNGKIVLDNGVDTIDCYLDSKDSVLFKDLTLDNKLVSIRELYNITSGNIDYQKAKKTIEFCYSLALAKREAFDYSKIVSAITHDTHLSDEIKNNTFTIKSNLIDRGNGKGYKLCESVNIGIDPTNNVFFSLEEQRAFINSMLKKGIDDIDKYLDNNGLGLRDFVLNVIPPKESVKLDYYYARSIIDGFDIEKAISNSFGVRKLTDEDKEMLVKGLSRYSINNLYQALIDNNVSEEDAGYYVVNLFLENSYQGYRFEEICELPNLNEFIKTNLHKLNKTINPMTLNKYLNVIDDCNYIEDSYINLRDFQLRIKEEVDRIYSDNRRFAGVVLPTGGGKSFIAMSLMLEQKDKNIVYIAPQINILRNFKKTIVKYVAGKDPAGMDDKELDVIVQYCFPHLKLYTYQGIDKDDEEKLKKYDADFIILDELHHVGADKWNDSIKTLIKRNDKSKILGITATPERDSVKAGQEADVMRFMATFVDNYSERELAEKKYLACDINVIDAIQEGYLVCPKIISFDYNLADNSEYSHVLRLLGNERDFKVRDQINSKFREMQEVIEKAELRGVDEIVDNYLVDRQGRYILFLPRRGNSYSYDDEDEDMEDDKDYVSKTEKYFQDEIKKFKKDLALVDKKPVVDYIYSGRPKELNDQAIKHFESDQDSDHIKILVAVDMLNEGVHIDGIKGSFNYRKIDNKHLILSLQHLGRTIFAIDPNSPITDADRPVVFDKFNNYSNLDMDRLVNKTTTRSDLEKMRDIVFYVNKYGFIPNTDSENPKEKKKAITLRKIQQKYEKYTNVNLDDWHLDELEKYEISEILKLGASIDLWDIEFAPVTAEEVRKTDRVNLFEVKGYQKDFLDLYHSINDIVAENHISSEEKIKRLLTVLDYLAEYNVDINPKTVKATTTLKDMVQSLSQDVRDNILFDLKNRGIKDNYNLGEDYYLARSEMAKQKGYFSGFNPSVENIINFRKFGLFENGNDSFFVNDRGFIVNGAKQFIDYNIWTGTLYDEKGFDNKGYNVDGFKADGTYKQTGNIYDQNGFDVNHINNKTGTKLDEHGFDYMGIHSETGTKYNPRGFDQKGLWYSISDRERDYGTNKRYDEGGFSIDGIHKTTQTNYDKFGFDVNHINNFTNGLLDKHGFDYKGIHSKTGTLYDPRGFAMDGFWHDPSKPEGHSKRRTRYDSHGYDIDGYDRDGLNKDSLKTISRGYLDEHFFDSEGYYYKLLDGQYVYTGKFFNEQGFKSDGVNIDTGSNYDRYGFDIDHINFITKDQYDKYGFDYRGIHRETGSFLDPRGFGRDGYWHSTSEQLGGKYTRSKYDPDGYDIDGYDENGFNMDNIHKKTNKKLNKRGFDANGYYYKKQGEGYVNTGRQYDERGFDVNGYYYKKQDEDYVNTGKHYDERGFDANGYYYKKIGNIHVKTGRKFDERGYNQDGEFDPDSWILEIQKEPEYNELGFYPDGIHHVTNTKLDERGFDMNGFWYKPNKDEIFENTGSLFNENGWNIRGQRIRINENGKEYLDYTDDYGFDEKEFYHLPKFGMVKVSDGYKKVSLSIDGKGYKDYCEGFIRFERYPATAFGVLRKFDAHGFYANGIHKSTGTYLDPFGFDRDGYFYERNEDGELVNTQRKTNELGFTIDQRVLVKGINGYSYETTNKGFDITGRYKNGSIYNDNGFSVDGIHRDTLTTVDTRGFDCHGIWHKIDENGQLVSTGSRFDDTGWSQNKTNVETERIVDKHGFDYNHLFRNNNMFDIYDKHGFDYKGIHKTTKTNLNKRHFDWDGFYYKKNEAGEYVNTGSKFDDEGFDIEGLDVHGFSKNGYYKGKSKKVNHEGFDQKGFNILTSSNYDEKGRDIDGNLVALSPEEIKKLANKNKQTIEEIWDQLSDSDKDLIAASYDVIEEEIEDYEQIEDFTDAVNKRGIKEDYEPYTEEEVFEFIKGKAEERYESKRSEYMRDSYYDSYATRITDGDIPFGDIDRESFDQDIYDDIAPYIEIAKHTK